MKIVLKQDVKSIGKKDGVYEVSDGYARNFLFPRGLAVQASASAVNAQALAKKIEGKTVALKAKAGQGGRLFGSVTAKDIAEGLSKLVGEPVDKRKVVLDTDIKSFGTYELELRVYPQVVAKLKVKVEE